MADGERAGSCLGPRQEPWCRKSRGWGCVLEWRMAWRVFNITFPLKNIHFICVTPAPNLLLENRIAGKPFDAGPVCIRHTLTHSHTHTENTFHPPYTKQPIALAGICDPNPYFNFPPLMQTNSILVAFPQKRSSMWGMSFFSCRVYKKAQSETILPISIMS